MFYLTTHSTHFIYGYMASHIWSMTTQIAIEETCCRHIGYSFRLTAKVLIYAPSHRQDNTYHGLCYTSRGALAGTRNSSMGPPPFPEYIDKCNTDKMYYVWNNIHLDKKNTSLSLFILNSIHVWNPFRCREKSDTIVHLRDYPCYRRREGYGLSLVQRRDML